MSHLRALGWLINLILHHKNWSKTQVLGEVFQYSQGRRFLRAGGVGYLGTAHAPGCRPAPSAGAPCWSADRRRRAGRRGWRWWTGPGRSGWPRRARQWPRPDSGVLWFHGLSFYKLPQLNKQTSVKPKICISTQKLTSFTF